MPDFELDPNMGGWAGLPDILMEEIFSYLPNRAKAVCSSVCQNWYCAFFFEKGWDTFIYRDYVYTRKRFTMHSGYQYTIDHWKIRFLVNRTTRLWRHIIVKPFSLLANFYEFIRVITNFSEYYENFNEQPLSNIRSFEFDWKLHVPSIYKDPKPEVFGTGGQMLKAVTSLLSHLTNLEMLGLRHLLLDGKEADKFMDELLEYFSQKITNLSIINLTKTQHTFFHLGLFLNLEKLAVSPQHLNDDVVILLSGHQCLRNIYIIQDDKTKGSVAVEGKTWRNFTKSAPKIKVHLRIRGRTSNEIVWQPHAPVVSIVYDTPYARLRAENAVTIVENYSSTLETFVQGGLQRQHEKKDFEDRADSSVIMLIRHCSVLKTLAIREKLSTATVLLAAQIAADKDEFYFCVRRNALLKRSDWPYNQAEWTTDFYNWLNKTSRNYETTELELKRLLKGKGHILTDDAYKHSFDMNRRMLKQSEREKWVHAETVSVEKKNMFRFSQA